MKGGEERRLCDLASELRGQQAVGAEREITEHICLGEVAECVDFSSTGMADLDG